MPLVCDGLARNKIASVGKNSGAVLSRLWTKVHEILKHLSANVPSALQRHLSGTLCQHLCLTLLGRVALGVQRPIVVKLFRERSVGLYVRASVCLCSALW